MACKDGMDCGVVEKPKSSGKWWVRLYANGRELWHRCETKSQAKALYGRLKAEQHEGKYFEKPRQVPCRQLMRDYIAEVDVGRRRQGDDHARAEWWIEAFGDRDATTIRPGEVERRMVELQDQGHKASTVVRYVAVLKAALNRAKRLGLIQGNPALVVRMPRINNVLMRYLTANQEASLLAALPERFHRRVIPALNRGLRQGELLRLEWADVDWHVSILTINETKAGDRRRAHEFGRPGPAEQAKSYPTVRRIRSSLSM